MYQVKLLPKTIHSLEALDKPIAARIIDKLEWLAENVENLQLTTLTGQFSGFCKLKIGDYRAIYDVDRDNKVITIFKVGHRREIYR